jgi:cobyrinic acid a,c-diamide synthase
VTPMPSMVTLPPRLVVAGLAGDSGKTLISLELAVLARRLGLNAAAFKKGPDYIDAAWLSWASGRPARNLDTYLMGVAGVQDAFARHAAACDITIVEGNRGLFDGVDAQGSHSSAELAKALHAPVLLVVNATKVTRTVAACVLGCQRLDPGVKIAGVVLNRVAGARHERVMTEAVETACEVPVVGVVPRMSADHLLPGRHLGLVPPAEHHALEDLEGRLAALGDSHLDLPRILDIARRAPVVQTALAAAAATTAGADGHGLVIGFVRDSAFTFYYPENLEALESAGATLVPVSSLESSSLPPGIHALYIGGGFPETHAERIAGNASLLEDVRRGARSGLPIFAECGGLVLLAQTLRHGEQVSRMAGVLPCEVELCAAPQGHGYTELVVDTPNAFFPAGEVLRGHEFHYARVVPAGVEPPTACAMTRGTGSLAGRDAFIVNNVWASFTHLHAASSPEWAGGIIRAARGFANGAAVR